MGWLIALVLLVVAYNARQDVNRLRRRIVEAEAALLTREREASEQRSLDANGDLIVLRLHLDALREAGRLSEDEYRDLARHIEAYWSANYYGVQPAKDSEAWMEAAERGWNLLRGRGLIPFSVPPWRSTKPAARPTRPDPDLSHAPAPAGPLELPAARPVARPAQPAVSAPKLAPEWSGPIASAAREPPAPAQSARHAQPAPAPQTARPAQPARPSQPAPAMQSTAHAQSALPPQSASSPSASAADAARPAQRGRQIREMSAHAWEPVEPGPVERALRAMSGWPKALVPFLVQNVGWFIGGFLFLAGTVFLVAYTTGFAKTAIVWGSLFGYTMFLIWAGYKLLSRQPALTAAGSVLLCTGLLLVPLTLASVAVLLRYGGGSSLLLAAGLGTAVVSLVTFYYAAQLVAGVVHRSLQGDYARLFLGVAGLQLTAPLVSMWPSWPVLAVQHLLLLVLVGYGLVRFVREWLRSVFVDRKNVTLFASGALLYAVVITFVHWVWAAPSVELPPGYYAPYLMAVCGLLFYVDAELKLHENKAAFLSRFTFLIYGLTVVAVVMSFDAPAARLVTLALAAVIYAVVLWKYLTLVPLYLMLASLGALYAWGILDLFPRDLLFLLALPGIFALSRLSRWATARGGRHTVPETAHGLARVGRATYNIVLLLLPATAALSLARSGPGLLGTSTALVLAAALAWWLRRAPEPLPADGDDDRRPPNLLDGPWLYAVVAAVTASVFYAPLVTDASRAMQASFGLMGLGLIWAARLVFARFGRRPPPAERVEVYANSALLSVFAGTLMAATVNGVDRAAAASLIPVFVVGATVIGTLSLRLYVRWLFYVFLLYAGAAAALVKLTYFPQPSVGLIEMLAGLGLAALVRWLDGSPDELSEITRRRAWSNAPRRLLWVLPCAGDEDGGDGDVTDIGTSPLLSAAGPEGRAASLNGKGSDV